MQLSDLIVEVRDSTLARVGQLIEIDLEGLTVATRVNAVGSWQIALPDSILDDSGELVPHALCASLRTEGAGLVVTGPYGVIISGPMTEAQFEASADDPTGTWTITGVSDAILLQDALAYPDPATGDPSAQRYANDVRTGPAETLLRSYVGFNICNGAIAIGGPTSWAPAGRLVGLRNSLRLHALTSRGPTLTFAPRFDNLLTLCQQIAAAGGLTFDVVQNGSYLEFTVSQPVDRSPFVRMDIDNGQLTTVDYGYGAPTATHPIVAGQGDGIARTIVERTSAAANASEVLWGRRIEAFVDQRQTNDLTQLQQAGDAILTSQGVTIPSMKVTPSDDLAMIYMRDWALGDLVSVTVGTRPAVSTVTEAALVVNNGVLVGATVGDPVGFEPEDVQASSLSSTESRVSNLETNAVAGVPCGTSISGYWPTAPLGYLLEDGTAYSQAAYPDLYALIGTTFGAGAATVRENVASNPASATNTTSYSMSVQNGGTGTVARIATGGPAGIAATFTRGTVTAIGTGGTYIDMRSQGVGLNLTTAGQVYSFSAYTRSSVAGAVTMYVQWTDASSAVVRTDQVSPGSISAAVWTRYSIAGLVAPDTSIRAVLIVRVFCSPAVNMQQDLTAVLIEKGSVVGNYFDNTTPAGGGVSYALSAANTSIATVPGFNVPDSRGRVPVGVDTSQAEFNALGKTGGSKAHAHPLSDAGQAALSINSTTTTITGRRVASPAYTNTHALTAGTVAANSATGNLTGTALTGTTDAASTLAPYLAKQFAIKF